MTSISVKDFPDGALLVASTSADKTLRLWKRPARSQDAWTALQVIDYAPKMMECVSIGLIELPKPNAEDGAEYVPIIATGGVDRHIHLYVENPAQEVRVREVLLALQPVLTTRHQCRARRSSSKQYLWRATKTGCAALRLRGVIMAR